VIAACRHQKEWPAQIAAGIYAGVDFAISNPDLCRSLTIDVASEMDSPEAYQQWIKRLADLMQARAPAEARLPGATDEALIGGMVGLVSDHVRLGRLGPLKELRPELVLFALLPYMGFEEAQRWANAQAD
jgi:hypothetical protein